MKRIISIVLCCAFLFCLSACEKFDENYGKSSAQPQKSDDQVATNEIKIPEIKSDDSVMPTYFDISLYDEENYADIYLGKKFKYKVTYCGSTFDVPVNYKDVIKDGWTLMESDEYNEDSHILAGKSITVDLIFKNNTPKKVMYSQSSKIISKSE